MRKLLLIFLLFVIPASAVEAQYSGGANRTSTLLEKFFGDGETVPWGRIVFHLAEGGELCVTVGAKRGPGALSSKSLVFEQYVGGRPQRLDFHFTSKPDRIEDDYLLWETCLEQPSTSQSLLGVTVRNLRGMQQGQAAQKMSAPYPDGPLASGINLVKGSSGQLEWKVFQKTYGAQ